MHSQATSWAPRASKSSARRSRARSAWRRKPPAAASCAARSSIRCLIRRRFRRRRSSSRRRRNPRSRSTRPISPRAGATPSKPTGTRSRAKRVPGHNGACASISCSTRSPAAKSSRFPRRRSTPSSGGQPRGGPPERRVDLRLGNLELFAAGDLVEQEILAHAPLCPGTRFARERVPVGLLGVAPARGEIGRVLLERGFRLRLDEDLRRRNRRLIKQRIEDLAAQLAAAGGFLLHADRARDLLAELFEARGAHEVACECIVEGRELLFLQSHEGELVLEGLAGVLGVAEICREGLPERARLPRREPAERFVDLRHRVGVADLERHLLVPAPVSGLLLADRLARAGIKEW